MKRPTRTDLKNKFDANQSMVFKIGKASKNPVITAKVEEITKIIDRLKETLDTDQLEELSNLLDKQIALAEEIILLAASKDKPQ